MSWYVLLVFFLTKAITLGSCGSIPLKSPEYYVPSLQDTQAGNLEDSFGLPSNSVMEANIVRQKRFFDTYNTVCAFCISGPEYNFNFGKEHTVITLHLFENFTCP